LTQINKLINTASFSLLFVKVFRKTLSLVVQEMRSLSSSALDGGHDSSLVIDIATAHVEQYQHTPLPAGNWIRYFVLAPGTITEPMSCRLQAIEIPDGSSFETNYTEARNSLPFEVLSYAWDTSFNDKVIFCDQKPLPVTDALFDALLRIRLPTESRSLWAAAICINELDSNEKEIQVSLMARIHAFSKRTLIWLGPDGGHGDSVASLLKSVGQFSTNGPPLAKSDPMVRDERWKSLKAMRASRWFQHVWGAQEACLGRAALMMYGMTEFSWASLNHVEDWLSKRGKVVSDEYDITPNWIYQNTVWSKPFLSGSNFLRFLEASKFLYATDARDHIYAMLGSPYTRTPNRTLGGTLNRRCGFVFEPNYETSHLGVYHDFSVQYLKQIQNMSLLMYIEHDADSIGSGLPSWVPSWNKAPPNYLPIHIHDLRRDRSQMNTKFVESGVLSFRANILGSIQHSSPTLLPPNSQNTISPDIEKPSNQFHALWKRVHELFATKRQYWSDIKDSELLRQFADTLLCGREQTMERRQLHAHRASYCLRLHQRTGAGEVEVEEMARVAKRGDAEYFDEFLAQFYTQRKFVSCYEAGREYFALVPALTEPGDVVCQILGSTHHFVLRGAMKEGFYKIVGGAHVKRLRDSREREVLTDEEIFLC
jgi:hypothetical protein